MFEQAFLEKQKSRTWSMGASLMLELLVVGVLILIPLANTEAIQRTFHVVIDPPAGPPQGEPPAARPAHAAPVRVRPGMIAGRLQPPTRIPEHVLIVNEPPEARPPDNGLVPGMPPGGNGRGTAIAAVLNGLGSGAGVRPAEPRPAPRPAPPSKLVRIAHMDPATIISRPQPVYPEIAKIARIEGVVRLAAVINEQGAIEDLRVIDGPVLLVNAAVAAVRNWRYRPLIMNGVPTKIETNIEVRFSLRR